MSRIAFSRWTQGGCEHLFVMRADGADAKQLTGAHQGECYCPSWSPDGQHLCFVSRRDGYSSLYVIDADGGVERRLTSAGGVDDDHPDWSPDGRLVAFSRSNGESPDGLWLVDLQSGEERQLTSDDHVDYRASWSPDGAHLVFRRSLSGRPGIHVMPISGATPQYVTRGQDPCWSPVGGRVVYSYVQSLWTLDVDEAGLPTGRPVQLTLQPGAVDRFPSWSREGTQIVFEREEEREETGTCRIMAITAAGGDVRDLGEGRMPDWSPDSGDPNQQRER